MKSIKYNQQELNDKVADISTRLGSVETKLSSFDSGRDDISSLTLTTEALKPENNALKARLEDLEDRSWTDNLFRYSLCAG